MSVEVEVVYALPDRQWAIELSLSDGTTASEAEAIVGKLEPMCWIEDWHVVAFGVWGEKVESDYVLQDGDRLELLRPLVESPMAARRRKANEAR